jgi:hypothetical protein
LFGDQSCGALSRCACAEATRKRSIEPPRAIKDGALACGAADKRSGIEPPRAIKDGALACGTADKRSGIEPPRAIKMARSRAAQPTSARA